MHSPFGYSKLDHPEVLRFLFHPRRDTSPPPAGALDHDFPVAADVELAGRFFPAAEPAAPTILFFHGNGETISDYDEVGPRFAGQEVGFLVVDYRGYGRSSGTSTASNMLEDAHRVLAETSRWLGQQGYSGPLLVMGRSLGCAPAIELAAAHQGEVAGLIIDSGFALTMPLLLCLGVDVEGLGLTEADGFKNQVKIALVQKPTYILHGQHDEIIPITLAEVLQAQCGARSKEFSIVPGADHNTIIERTGKLYFEAIGRFAAKAARPSRSRRAHSGVRS